MHTRWTVATWQKIRVFSIAHITNIISHYRHFRQKGTFLKPTYLFPKENHVRQTKHEVCQSEHQVYPTTHQAHQTKHQVHQTKHQVCQTKHQMGTFSRPEKMVAYKNDKCEVWFSGVTAGLHIFLFRSIDPLLKASEEEECKLYTEKSKTVIAWDVLYLTTFLCQDIQNLSFLTSQSKFDEDIT